MVNSSTSSVTLNVSNESFNLIIEALGYLPFSRVNPTICSLVEQVNKQLEKPLEVLPESEGGTLD